MSDLPASDKQAKKKISATVWIILACILFIAVAATGAFDNPSPPSTAIQRSNTADTTRSTVAPDKWEYSSSTYGIDNESFKSATTSSRDAVNFAFPYSKSDNYGHLTIAKRGKQTQVYLRVDEGQFNGAYSGLPVKVKFDQGKVKTFYGFEPTDNQTGWLFISNEKGFISALKNAKTVKIEAEFFQQGSRVFVFDVAGLDAQRIGL